MKLKPIGVTPEQFVKRTFYLLWQACGSTRGMGAFQDNPEAQEDSVWRNVMTDGDYVFGGNDSLKASKSGRPYGDYVFGRMNEMGMRV